ncbi:MAG TPA: type IV toxin-antitoxin system AbiEi family antitoxin domain-containing protein [Phycisphaerae bacterium]|nr:type IV toxin-antitoxin system AbiEi family antitoxin domain-containing protein [Phycisphaerae bacterium]
MNYRDTQESLRAIYAIAVAQGGYFTAKQAAEAGYGYSHLVYHLHAGNFDRAGHGLYRLPTVPTSEHDDFIRLALWSRNRADKQQAVISHESALLLHQLSDVLPNRIHLTVPLSFRKGTPKGCVISKARLSAREIEEREGFSVTTPLRTLTDVAASISVTDEHLAKAVDDALRRGLVRETELKERIESSPGASRLAHAFSQAR